ncbi:putative hydrolase [Actinacidiphila reveromycinica]|uniref:Putative hydrolase n=1 Tax=Actinacidiphila reveromycinica TaxID=659352 RepID=A0A7U3VSD1_9ACTN|nr:alpha/beta fold hydrolase [Streptomyces sp. SN-593]BBB01710.1 putative hydrolase [Streptomyces sp. SN-593]
MGSVHVNGITIGHDDTGGGGGPEAGGGPAVPLLLVHGHPFDRTMWGPQVAVFGAGRRVIAPDLRGYGKSTVRSGSTGLDVFARDLAALLDALEVERAVLCGLSMGGQVVLEFHRLFAARVAGLVLADTFAQGETPAGRKERYDRAEVLERDGMAAYAHGVLDSMVDPGTVRDQPEVAAHVLRMMLGAPPQGAAAALRGRAERPDYTGTLARIAVPTLVVVGRRDVFTPVSDAEFLHERIAGSRLAVVEGAGHMPNLERPGAFDAALAGLLAAVDARER